MLQCTLNENLRYPTLYKQHVLIKRFKCLSEKIKQQKINKKGDYYDKLRFAFVLTV